MYDMAINPVDKISGLMLANVAKAFVWIIKGHEHDQIAAHNRDMGLEFHVVRSEGVQSDHRFVCRLVVSPVSESQEENLDTSVTILPTTHTRIKIIRG